MPPLPRWSGERELTAVHAAVFLAAFLLLAGHTLGWPMIYDDLHLIRSFSLREMGAAFVGTYDPDNMEVGGYRPLTVLFNNARHRLFGESVLAHRLFLMALYAAFLAGLGVAARALGARTPEVLAGGLLGLLSRYSTYHYAFLTDGAHVVQGVFFLAALAALWAWMRAPRAALLAGSLAAVAAGILFREDTLGAVPALWLLAWAGYRRTPRVLHRLALHAGLTIVLVAALLLLRAWAVPDSPRPAVHIGGWLEYVARTAALAGSESFDPLSRWIVGTWLWAPVLLLLGVAVADGAHRLRALAWTACALAACSPALTLRREDLLFFPASFAGLAYAAALAGIASRFRRALIPVAAVTAWLAAGEAYLTREFLRVFHPLSSTSILLSGAFVYGYYGEAQVPPRRRQDWTERLAAQGIRSTRDYFDKLPRRIYNAEREGRRDPTADGRLFVPRLQFRAFKP